MNMRIGLRIQRVLLLLILASISFSQARQSSGRRSPVRTPSQFQQKAKSYKTAPHIVKAVFKNGLTVLVNEFSALPLVTIQAYVDIGLLNEPPAYPGIASLLPAMILRGSPDPSKGTFRQRAQVLGSVYRSETTLENTCYEIISPSDQWKKALRIQAEALLNPSINPEELELEKRLLVNKARAILDDPDVFSNEGLLELGFDQSRIAKWHILAEGAADKISREELVGFYKSMYSPSKTTLVFSGDVSFSEVLNEVAGIYDETSRAFIKKYTLDVQKTQEGFRYRAIHGNIPIPYLLFGFHTVSEKSRDFRALEVLSAILGSGEGSVLTSRLRDQKGLIIDQKTTLHVYSDFGYLSVKIRVDPENIDRSEIAVLTELELLKRNVPDAAEMERAFAQLELDYWKRLETVTGRAQILKRLDSLDNLNGMDGYVSEIRKVTPGDIKRVAQRYLRLRNCSLLEYLPDSLAERNLTTETAELTFEGLIKPSADQEDEKRAEETVYATDIPPSTDNFKFSEIRYPFQPASILRGPDIFIREDHTAPVIDMGFYFPSGKLAENKENSGITELMLNVMLQGAKDYAGPRFHRQLEIYGGMIQPIVSDDYFGFQFSILSRNFDAGFKLLQETIKVPAFNPDSIKRQKQIQSAKILSCIDSIDYPIQMENRFLFKDFSYALPTWGTEATIAGIASDALQNWHKTYVKNKKPVVAIIGDTKGTSLASYFVKHFSGSRFNDTQIAQEFTKPVNKAEAVEHKWKKRQSLILVGFQAPSEDDEDRYAASLIPSYLGGMGRLNQEIRDRMGAANKITVTYTPRLRGGSMIIVAPANKGSEDLVLDTIQDEIKRLDSTPVKYGDLRSARNAAIGIAEIKGQLRAEQIRNIVMNVLAGKGLEGFNKYATNLQALRGEDLKEAARRIFKMDKAVIIRAQGQSE